ncbi:MAG: hypothetical protein AAGK04_09225 [Planctomycetota bacterium]
MKRGVLIGAGVILVALVAWWGVGAAYLQPRAALEERLDEARANVVAFEDRLQGRARLDRRLAAIAARTLARSGDRASHHLRTSLTELARACGLRDVVVSDGRPKAMPNPAGQVRPRLRRPIGPLLNEQRDAMLMRGQVRGEGDLRSCLDALARVQAQPWIHAVEGFGLKPKGDGRELFDIRIDVATLLLPDAGPAGDASPELVPVSEEAAARVAAIVATSPFVVPPIVVVADPVVPAPVAAPPAPATPRQDARWRLVGVVSTARGAEAWLSRTDADRDRVVPAGGRILEFRFVEGSGERAIFEREGVRFVLSTGQTLDQRVVLP